MTLVTVVNAGVSRDYNDKVKLLVVRIILLFPNLSLRLLCLEISINCCFLSTLSMKH